MEKYNFENIYFLIVDDNRHMRFITSSIIKGFGARKVFEADDGEAALAIMKETPIDILVTDCVMGPLDGYQLTKHIRAHPESPNPYVPIIMITGYTELHRVTHARDSGVNEFLVKPVSAQTLLSRIIRVIDNPRPFVNCKAYVGPDRRRNREKIYGGPERRGTGELSLAEVAAPIQSGKKENLPEDDVKKLFAQK